MASNNTIRSMFGRGAPACLKSSVITLFCIAEFRLGARTIQLDNLNAMSVRVTRAK